MRALGFIRQVNVFFTRMRKKSDSVIRVTFHCLCNISFVSYDTAKVSQLTRFRGEQEDITLWFACQRAAHHR